MAITAITIENFKGIGEPVRVELKPITLLFGPNSAGKSTIIQALHYAREIFERQNLNPDRTLLGGDSVDLGGFQSLVHNHDTSLPIKLAFELDLSNEDLPTYSDGEIQYIGTGLLDNAGSAYLLRIVSRVKKATVEVVVKWSKQLVKPYLSTYTVSTNGFPLIVIESSPDALQVYISKINPFNPIFLEVGIDPEGVREAVISYFDQAMNVEPNSDDFHEDQPISDLGDALNLILQHMEFEQGYSGLTKPINLEGQESSLPRWARNLDMDITWAKGIEMEVEPNFIRMLSSLTVGPGELIRDGLRKLCYVGPLREVPGRNHKPATSPDNSRWSNGLAAYDTLFFSDENLIDKVNEWLGHKERLDSGYSVHVKTYRELDVDNPLMLALLQGRILDEDMNLGDLLLGLPVVGRLLLRDEARGIELAPQDIGVGISQVLPVVVAALHHNTGIVAIEQPELHIHPGFQVALGDLFIEQVRERPDLTFILETHSEHLLLRFLRRIRETGENEAPDYRSLTPAELAIYFIEPGDTGITVTPIRVDEDGDFIDRWPRGFFAERAGELF